MVDINTLLKKYDLDPAIFTDTELLGNPTTLTQALGNNSTRLANTAFVMNAIAALLDSAPGVLDTLNELAAALGDDPNFAATMATALAGKQPLDADLTALSALSTVAFGRGFNTLADAAAARTYIGAQPLATNLTNIAALAGLTVYGFGFLQQTDASTALTKVGIVSTDFTPVLSFGGASVGMTGTFLGRKLKIGRHVWVEYDIRLTAKGSSTGAAAILLPTDPAVTVGGSGRCGHYQNMSGIGGGVDTLQNPASSTLALISTGATQYTTLQDTNFSNTTILVGRHEYIAAP